MGNIWLHDLDDVLRRGVGRGIVALETLENWETRCRSTGGFDRVNGVLEHHTASPESWDWEKDIQYLAYTNPYAPSPVCNIYIGREGKVCVIAAGAANHGGKGGAYKPDSPRYVDIDRANPDLIGKEMGNDGVGETWPWKQIMASLTVDALLADAFNWPAERFFGHKEYCGPNTTTPGRKIDPYGPWENHPELFWPTSSTWGAQQGNLNIYRALVSQKRIELNEETNTMEGFVPRPPEISPRILDSRGPAGPNHDAFKMAAGVTVDVAVPNAAGKQRAVINLTATEGDAPGFFTAWAEGPRPTSSSVNWATRQTVANEIIVDLAPDGRFKLYPSSRVHVVIDLVGYMQTL